MNQFPPYTLGPAHMASPNARIEGCEVIQVIRLVTVEGEGIKTNVVRHVYRYYSMKGELLALHDVAPNTTEPP